MDVQSKLVLSFLAVGLAIGWFIGDSLGYSRGKATMLRYDCNTDAVYEIERLHNRDGRDGT